MASSIKAAGKTLSSENANSLKQSALSIVKILIQSGDLTKEELNKMFSPEDEIDASVSSDFLAQRWKEHLVAATELFCCCYVDKPNDGSLVQEYIQELKQCSENLPNVLGHIHEGELRWSCFIPWMNKIYSKDQSFAEKVKLTQYNNILESAFSAFLKNIECIIGSLDVKFTDKYGDRSRKEVFDKAVDDLETILLEMVDDKDITANSLKSNESESISITCSAKLSPLKASAEHPYIFQILGTLFTAERVSDMPPTEGTFGLPMYIDALAAKEAIERIGNIPLPLNMMINLSGHDKKASKVGVTTKIWLNDDNRCDAVGVLHPVDQQEKEWFQSLSDQDILGMSIEAKPLKYEIKEIEGTQVYYLKKFDITGAAILQRDKAADQSTTAKITPLIQRDVSSIPIAASGKNSENQQGNKMNEFEEQILASIETLGNKFDESNQKLEERQNKMEEQLAPIVKDYQKRQEAIAASNSQQVKEQEQKQLVETINEVVKANNEQVLASLDEKIQTLKNPLGAMPRKTFPAYPNPESIAASGNQREVLQQQLWKKKGAYEAGDAASPEGLRLLDEITLLEAQIGGLK